MRSEPGVGDGPGGTTGWPLRSRRIDGPVATGPYQGQRLLDGDGAAVWCRRIDGPVMTGPYEGATHVSGEGCQD
jgi:hypothetical protein